MSVIPSELKAQWDTIAAKYETKRASMLPVLQLAQRHFGFISPEAEEAVAEYVGVTPVHVREVVTFYELFRTKPEGRNQIRFCRTLSCTLVGGGNLLQYLREKLGIEEGQTTPDGKFSLHAVECLGACEIAPMMQVNGDFYGPLTKQKIDEILKRLTLNV